MGRIQLILPTKEHEKQVLAYKKEFEINADSMDGCARLEAANSYDEWLQRILDNSKPETVREGLVVASSYLAVREDDGKVVGMINIRHTLNDYLFQHGGHIGYSVRKSERRKGYAKEMLRLALEKCKEMSIKRVLVTCDKNNIASAKTIISNGGILENEVLEEEEITQRYWIDLR